MSHKQCMKAPHKEFALSKWFPTNTECISWYHTHPPRWLFLGLNIRQFKHNLPLRIPLTTPSGLLGRWIFWGARKKLKPRNSANSFKPREQGNKGLLSRTLEGTTSNGHRPQANGYQGHAVKGTLWYWVLSVPPLISAPPPHGGPCNLGLDPP